MQNKRIKEKIRVCHIIYDLSTAGAQTVVMNYLRQIENNSEFEFVVLIRGKYNASTYENEAKEKGYKVYYCNYEPWLGNRFIRPIVNWLKCQVMMFREIRKIKPDIIHTHLANIVPFVALPSLFTKAKVKVHTLHSDPYAVSKGLAVWTKIALKYLGFFPICVTEDQAEKAVKRYSINNYKVIHNGLNIERYALVESKRSIRESLGIPEDAFVICTVGSLYKTKNIDFLIDVYAKYKTVHSNAFLLIVGDGVDRKILEQKCEKLNLSGYLFTGKRDDVERMYKSMDVFMLTSLFESSSIVTVEAQLSGIRCILSEAIPKSVIISDSVNRLSLNDSIDYWIAALEEGVVCEKKENEAEMFTISKMTEDTCHLYKCLLGRKGNSDKAKKSIC